MRRSIADIDAYAFIDDSCLIGLHQSLHQLQAAVDVTKLWDELTGQALNERKCNIFGTTSEVRRDLKVSLPNMKLVEIVEVFGSFLQTA